MIEETLIVGHEAGQPEVVSDLFDADVLTGERFAEISFAAAEASAFAAGHCMASANRLLRQLVETYRIGLFVGREGDAFGVCAYMPTKKYRVIRLVSANPDCGRIKTANLRCTQNQLELIAGCFPCAIRDMVHILRSALRRFSSGSRLRRRPRALHAALTLMGPEFMRAEPSWQPRPPR